MALIRITKLDLNPAAVFLGLVLAIVFSAPAQAYLNRSYSSLELAQNFQGDFMGILAQGKLRILLTRDNSRASYLPRQGSPLAEQQRIA